MILTFQKLKRISGLDQPAKQIMRPKFIMSGPHMLALVPRLCGFDRVAVPEHILPLDQLRAIGDADIESGVYFLWRGPALVYVGQSSFVANRVHTHRAARDGLHPSTKKRILFDRATGFSVSPDQRHAVERDYICAYLPPYNDKIP